VDRGDGYQDVTKHTKAYISFARYLENLLQTYMSLRPIGQVLGEPFVLRLDTPEKRTRREPDLMVVLDENPHELTETYMDGPADICIEIVSEESSDRDHGEKFSEYERAGVREYWIVDPLRNQCRFNRLNENGTYDLIYPIKDTYTSPLLPDLKITVSTLWQTPLPRLTEVVAAVQAMLKD
jgi:Uma2 family endonuclease